MRSDWVIRHTRPGHVELYVLYIGTGTDKHMQLWRQCCHYYSTPLGVRSIVSNPFICLSMCLSMCLSTSISLETLDRRSSRNSVCIFHVTVARSSSSSVAIHYLVPVLWMTSHFATVDLTQCREVQHTSQRSVARSGRSHSVIIRTVGKTGYTAIKCQQHNAVVLWCHAVIER